MVPTNRTGAHHSVRGDRAGQYSDQLKGRRDQRLSNDVGRAPLRAIHDGLTKYTAVDVNSSGDNTIIAAAGAGKQILVLGCVLIAAGAVNIRFEDGAGGTSLTGVMNLTTNSGFTLPFSEIGWFITTADTLLNLELSGATAVAGTLTYTEII